MNKPRILIVDDEPSFVRLLKLVMENTGRYSVRQESDAMKALEVAREFQPDLILLDFIMPKIDGGSVAQALRAEAQFSHIPILFLSATVVENNGFEAQIAGFPAFSKPIALDRLMAVIDGNLAAPPITEVPDKPVSLLSSVERRLQGPNGSDGQS